RLATSFLRPEVRVLLDQVEAITVRGPEVDRALLAAWLVDCFPGAVIGEERDHASTSIVLEGDDFRMSVESGPHGLTATLTRDGQDPWRSESAWSPPTTEGLLAESLLGLRSDPVFTRALSRT
ncbi:MAG TPA: OpcA/G6PD domain-containing protein, partial [Acidimicrobiales bacterium]|nr:OpcA/G6PD domain-containing protein [Acidimicrobiales bacterium]